VEKPDLNSFIKWFAISHEMNQRHWSLPLGGIWMLFGNVGLFVGPPERVKRSHRWTGICVVFRALEADSRSLHSLSSQHKRLSPNSSDPAAGGGSGGTGLSRVNSLSSIVSGASLGSVASTSQADECELLFLSSNLQLVRGFLLGIFAINTDVDYGR